MAFVKFKFPLKTLILQYRLIRNSAKCLYFNYDVISGNVSSPSLM